LLSQVLGALLVRGMRNRAARARTSDDARIPLSRRVRCRDGGMQPCAMVVADKKRGGHVVIEKDVDNSKRDEFLCGVDAELPFPGCGRRGPAADLRRGG
jgi:hypothetical protein